MCLYAAFIADEGKDDHRLVVALLGVSPMPAMTVNKHKEGATGGGSISAEAAEPQYAAEFNAKHMTHHFNTILSTYNHSIESLLIGFLVDNTSVNKLCAKDNDIKHLPCHNHVHALDIGETN